MPKKKKIYSKSESRPKVTIPQNESAEWFRIKVEKNNVPEDLDLKTAIRGMKQVDENLQKINSTVEKINSDRTLNDPAKAAEHVRYVSRMENNVYDAIEKVTKIVDRRTDELSKRINRPITKEASGREAPEIRSHVASIEDSSKRFSFIKQRIDAGDYESASAVLGSKFYLAGLSEDMQQELLNYYRKKRFAGEMKVKEQLEKIGNAALHKISIFEKYKKSISSQSTLKDIEAQKAREAAVNE